MLANQWAENYWSISTGGFDVPKLFAETASLLEAERQEEQQKLQRDLQRHKDEEYKRKFGKKNS